MFAARLRAKQEEWQGRLRELRHAGRRAVVWGGGAEAVSFLNLLELGEAIEVVVDINPGKQGSYLAGTGQRIVPPEFLREYGPDEVIVMNPVYRGEIESRLAELDVPSRVVSV